ncbi:5-carboxymethyl-2-hydroxymuconate semialdehyde dehydrogenase [Calidithermus timidus]|jgi:5-carboxymethyl-2-hydroxymuconic-semialdehyde dehydrogenase|uniref:5-carboxymethyl-2-hydroxymuconate semialdehyde dehydrogenase n=1 Tax=Calidithermus timidus TaxID=307124 RepID=UPI00035D78D5|nr:5-carboxymethyl-2-hydroxymuconate semialdehyde dehydrogenase [Calidithermus timidus]
MKIDDKTAGIRPEFIEQVRQKLASRTFEHYIGGQFVAGARGEVFETLDPATNRVLARVYRGHAEDIERAAQAAHKAFKTGWGRLKARERKKYLLKIASLIEKHGDELATIECLDAGQVLKIVRGQIARTAENFSFYADWAERAMDGRSYPVDAEWVYYTLRVPVGVCGIITPWNAPMMLSTWRIAPALAFGNTVILKPAEWSPLTAWKLAEIMQEADLPPGTFNVVQGFGEEAGAPLVAHPLVPLITLTGETTTGSIVMKNAADQLKRLSLELGGKSPAILFEDADFERALDATIFQIYSFNGERCTANSRALVQESILDEFVGRVAERAARVRVGHPLDPETEVGPLIHPEHLERVLGYVRIGQEEGARLVVGGERVGSEGNYMRPALFVGENHMRIAQEEIFGPVLTVIPFKDEADALAKANDVKYGLAAYVWTRDVTRAHRMGLYLESGMTWINSHNVRHLPTPFGGVKFSGTHREGGEYSLEFYTELKCIAVPLGEHPIPRFGN